MARLDFDPLEKCRDTNLFDRVERQLQLDSPHGTVIELGKFSLGDETHFFSAEHKNAQLGIHCRRLYDQIIDPGNQLEALDTVFSELWECNFSDYKNPQKVVADACHLLTRLPTFPLELPESSSTHGPRDVGQDSSEEIVTRASINWQGLPFAREFSTNVIRVAILVAIRGPHKHSPDLRNFIDNTASLLNTASQLSGLAASNEKRKWYIVRALLWSSWQRSNMLYFYRLVGGNVRFKFDDRQGQDMVLQGFNPVPDLSIQEMSKRFASTAKPAHMCGWAFELLRTSPCSIGSDFRNFFDRFSTAFGDREGRCIPGQPISCKGDVADSCQRFKGMKIGNQSLHSGDCRDECSRLYWSRKSYISVPHARAVRLEDCGPQDRLTYCEASRSTLAISHVWSHGQGGRPESGHGLNLCLHQRYVSIARSLGCDSYWMDTPCIPEEHKLRRQAILNINEIFENSKVTLICDRDLMSIDASNLTIEIYEAILVAALVCDWNLRAWTFLEAFRGRKNAYILCRDNTVVSMKETVEAVYHQGSLDIVPFLLAIPHLLPSRDHKEHKLLAISYLPGFMPLETGSSLLSYREASRPGDDLVIWSLLIDDKVYENAKHLWKGQQEKSLHTSFLFSSAPRLKTRGLRWAPRSPRAQLIKDHSNSSTHRLLVYDGAESSMGRITRDGFTAEWLYYDFPGGLVGGQKLSSLLDLEMEPKTETHHQINLDRIRKQYLRKYWWGALLRPIANYTRATPVIYRTDANKLLVAICGTNNRFLWPCQKDERMFWRWCGVYEWDPIEPLPKFIRLDSVLIV